ncbi:MAG: hypothetical protein ACOYK8_10030 [Alphaproteobacteria bacterium]
MKPAQPALKAIFNTANMSSMGAIFLSLGLGAREGAAIFAMAIVVGTYNKYQALTEKELLSQKNIWQKQMADPSLTAKIVMGAATINLLHSVYQLFNEPGNEAMNITKASAWLFGLVGDNALRRLDKVNFQQNEDVVATKKSPLMASMEAMTYNPTFFYNLSNISMVAVLLQNPSNSAFDMLMGGITASLYVAADMHALKKSWAAAQGQISAQEVNDGIMNRLTSVGGVGQGVLAGVTGNFWVAGAQIMFATSSMFSLYETRLALRKKNNLSL